MRARQQAGHMDASDLIKSMQRQSCKEGAVHIWGPDADRRAKLLIYLAVEGSLLGACSRSARSAASWWRSRRQDAGVQRELTTQLSIRPWTGRGRLPGTDRAWR